MIAWRWHGIDRFARTWNDFRITKSNLIIDYTYIDRLGQKMKHGNSKIKTFLQRFLLFPLVDCYAYLLRGVKVLRGNPTRHRRKLPLAYRPEDNY